MSSAAGGIWDFQILDVPNPSTGDHELQVVDMNFVTDTKIEDTPYTFNISGADSLFLEASFDMDVNGAIMNKVIGSRLSGSVSKDKKEQNSSMPPYEGKLFATGKTDLILKQIEDVKEAAEDAQKSELGTGETPTDTDDKEKKRRQEAFVAFLGKVGTVVMVDVLEETLPSDTNTLWDDFCYQTAYDDQNLFELLKLGHDVTKVAGGKTTSVLLPVKFHFKIHGVSGMKRGDKFRVNGLPAKYSTGGFFQVTAIKHTLDGMLWKTEIQGGFRQQNAAS
jgi:hypothetical protein